MKLLFDHNLSPRLIDRIKDIYSNSSHVSLLGMDRVSDETIWLYAKTNEYIIEFESDRDSGILLL